MSTLQSTQVSLRLKPLASCLAIALAVGFVADGGISSAIAKTPGTHVAPTVLAQRDRVRAREWDNKRAEMRTQVRNRVARELARTAPPAPRPAATLNVTSCADDGSAGTFRSVAASAVSGDVINLASLSCSTITLATGGVAISANDVSVVGPGVGALAINGNANGTVIDHLGSGTLSVSAITLTNGYYVAPYGYGAPGGAVFSAGSVTLTNAAVTNSTAYSYYANGTGGGVFASVDLTITNSTLSGNTANSYYNGVGGGGYAYGNMTVTNSTISGNDAVSTDTTGKYAGVGGGLYVAGNLTMTGSTISGNDSGLGGGIKNSTDGSVATITNSTFSGNTSAETGAALHLFSLLNLSNSTVTANNSGTGGAVTDQHYQSYGPSVFQSNIIAGNTGAGTYYGSDVGFFEDSVIGSNNLIISAPAVTLPADTLTTDPQLSALANNGGPTLTHAIAQTSPAKDTGNNIAALATDQRGAGFARVGNARADIGAFEIQGAPPVPYTYLPVPALSTWALGLMAGLLGLIGWRSRNGQRRSIVRK